MILLFSSSAPSCLSPFPFHVAFGVSVPYVLAFSPSTTGQHTPKESKGLLQHDGSYMHIDSHPYTMEDCVEDCVEEGEGEWGRGRAGRNRQEQLRGVFRESNTDVHTSKWMVPVYLSSPTHWTIQLRETRYAVRGHFRQAAQVHAGIHNHTVDYRAIQSLLVRTNILFFLTGASFSRPPTSLVRSYLHHTQGNTDSPEPSAAFFSTASGK